MSNSQPAKGKMQSIQVQQQHYSGPLPHPDALERYEQIVPGAAERIIRMAESEMEHRHTTEDRLAKNTICTAYLGIIFAFLSVIILSCLVFYSLYRGFDSVAASIAVGSIAAVAGVFVFFRVRKNK